jgi:DNA-binding XRE family transcriptional regulator
MTGAEIAARRERCGLTQAQMADYLGIGRTTVWRLETGTESVKRPIEVTVQTMDIGNPSFEEWIERQPIRAKRAIRLRQQRLK